MRRRAREDGAWIRVAFIKKYAGTVLGAALLLALAVFGITYRNEIWAVLTQQDARDAFIAFVHDSGFLGLLAFLGLQVLLLRQYMHNTEIAVTMRLSTILKTIKQPL